MRNHFYDVKCTMEFWLDGRQLGSYPVVNISREPAPQWTGAGACASFPPRLDRSKCSPPGRIGFEQRPCRLECFSLYAKPMHSPRIECDAIWPNSRLVGQVAFRFQPAIAGFRMNWNVKCLESGVFEQLRLLRLERYGQVTDNQTLQAQRRQEGPGGCGEATLLRKARSKGSSDRSLIGSSRSRKHSHRPEPAT